MNRTSGILLHPTSLPGSPGIGTIGNEARNFIDWLRESKQSFWQILPIHPTGYGDSPYQSFSTFAGNPLLIDTDMLVADGWLDEHQSVPPEYIQATDKVDFSAVLRWKLPLLATAAARFLFRAGEVQRHEYEVFKSLNAHWLENYAIFMSIKETFDRRAAEEHVSVSIWNSWWTRDLALYKPEAVRKWESEHREECEIQKVVQFFFFSQWQMLKEYAHHAGIMLIGDVPIFVAEDSADVWANQHLFQLDTDGRPLAVAGVPPDYFSASGQLWGNPLYDWDAMKKNRYAWWVERIMTILTCVDYVRIDHFRGFEAYWSVPAGKKNAITGEWKPGPNHALFDVLRQELGTLPIIAEDLGLITEPVRKLRDDYSFPGMRILQFAFDRNEAGKDSGTNMFLPHMYERNCVAYTGTHDNATLQGWLEEASREEKLMIGSYAGFESDEIDTAIRTGRLCRALIRLAYSSVANCVIIPLQDLFALTNDARMNIPSTTGGTNWQWRMTPELYDSSAAQWLNRMSTLYGRNAGQV